MEIKQGLFVCVCYINVYMIFWMNIAIICKMIYLIGLKKTAAQI